MTRTFVLLNPETSTDLIACVFKRLIGLITLNKCQCVSSDVKLTPEQVRCIFKHRASAQADQAALQLASRDLFCFEVRGPDALFEVRRAFTDCVPSLNPSDSPSDLRIAFIVQSLDEANAFQMALDSMLKRM